jgi:putative DNA primase/helicase
LIALVRECGEWEPAKAELLDEDPDAEEVRLHITPLQDVVSEQVKPLWPKRIFLGKLAVMAGDPGLGKSYTSLDIAARVSLGGPWPDASGYALRGNVLLVSAEDGVADTIKPRLELLGADMSRIFNLGLTVHKGEEEVGLSLQQHLPQIEREILEKKIILLVVDPLLAFTGKVDTHKTAEVRAVLSPMSTMAERTGCAILAVMHPNKNSKESNLLYRISASLDFAAAARSVMVVAKHPDNPDQRVMVTVKCNLSAHPEPMAFGFTQDGCFAWQGVTEVDMSQLMAPPDREDSSAIDDAKKFLQEVLADGEMPPKDVLAEARECGVAERTLRRAVKDLNIDVGRVGEPGKKGGGKWVWRLPPDDTDLAGC